ncbi:RNA-directed DNA polymerase, eukaryota [Tanacetum coccineum]
MDVKFMWGNSNYDFVYSESLGSSGGILCIWEESFFKKEYVTVSDHFVAIYGSWNPNKVKILLVAIYAPQDPKYRRLLWDYISIMLSRWNGEVILMGDFNEVRCSEERSGTCFNPFNSRIFDNFISSSSLVDVKMEGYSFTWSHPSANKMSKLDRFLVSEGVISLFPSITALCLDRHLSDHRPILLHEVRLDFGPVPFRLYHSWFGLAGFDEMVTQSWNSLSYPDKNGMIRFKKKLQELKKIIRTWIKDNNKQRVCTKRSISEEMRDIDKILDTGGVSESLLCRRNSLKCQLHDIKALEAMDSMQKSKVKWAVEGDENTKFFHGIINKKRTQLAVRGVFNDGVWLTDPILVKKAFQDHYASQFKNPNLTRFKINFTFPNRLSQDQVDDMERVVSWDEIRLAVWDCGENKSPGPDGFTFEFFRKYGITLGSGFSVMRLDPFFVNGSFSKGCNSSFVALIPKVTVASLSLSKDYRPISLIGCVYKVVTKIMAMRWAMVINGIVSDPNPRLLLTDIFLDGPFIFKRSCLQWCKR